MKSNPLVTVFIAATSLVAASLHAGTAEEKAFIDKFKTAFEAGDKATLGSFLYTKGADPLALENVKTMVTDGAGGKISKIELVDPTPEDAKKAARMFVSKVGEKRRYPLKPTRILNVTLDTKDGSNTTHFFPVALKDGKFVIPVPVPVK
jgi:hypothetical protein